jgi:hypothetical protein
VKITDSMRFPHPVLWDASGDYTNGHFGFDGDVVAAENAGVVQFSYNLIIDQTTLEAFMLDNCLAPTAIVHCPATYYTRQFPLRFGQHALPDIPAADLAENVTIRPIAWIKTDVPDFSPENLHPEFSGSRIALKKGDIVAIGAPVSFSIGRTKVADFSTIFQLVTMDEMDPWGFSVDPLGDVVQIIAGTKASERIQMLRNTTVGGPIVLNSVFLPALQTVLEQMSESDEAVAGLRWHRVLSARLLDLQIDIQKIGPLRAAQLILTHPLQKLNMGALA